MNKKRKNTIIVILAFFFFSPAVFAGFGADWSAATLNTEFSVRHVHTVLDYDNKMWVIGGADLTYPHKKDVWFSDDGVSWNMATGNAQFGERANHTSVVFDGKMWVISGEKNGSLVDDVWYSEDGAVWTLAAASAGFGGRAELEAFVFDNKIWITGGYSGSVDYNDVWYSSDGINWTRAVQNAPWGGRGGHASFVYDNKMWVVGGVGYNPELDYNDVWSSSNGTDWTLVTDSAAFGPRKGHDVVVYNGELILAGGFTWGTNYKDVWHSSDGINWESYTTNAPFSIAEKVALVYDNKVWVIAGGGGSNYVNEVWFTESTPQINQVCLVSDTDWKWINPVSGLEESVKISGNYVNYGNQVPGVEEPVWPKDPDIYGEYNGLDAEIEIYRTFEIPDNYTEQSYSLLIQMLADDYGSIAINGVDLGCQIFYNSSMQPHYSGQGCDDVTSVEGSSPYEITYNDADGSLFKKGTNTITATIRGIDCCSSWFALSMCVDIEEKAGTAETAETAEPTLTFTVTNTKTATYTLTETHTPEVSATPTQEPAGVQCLLEDSEDGNNANMYGGFWYTYVDGQGATTITPAAGSEFTMTAGGNDGSLYAVRISGDLESIEPSSYPCAGVGTQLNPNTQPPVAGGTSEVTDISNCEGIRFYAKGDGNDYLIKIPYSNADGESLTGYNDYKFTFKAGTAWTEIKIDYTCFEQETGWGVLVDIQDVLENAKEIQWQTGFNPESGTAAYDLWIDDIVFYGCDACTGSPAMPTETPTVIPTHTPSYTHTAVHTSTDIPTQAPTQTHTPAETPVLTPVVEVTPEDEDDTVV
ncbi:MAG: hypothetical protein ACOC4H_00385 [bacterium]